MSKDKKIYGPTFYVVIRKDEEQIFQESRIIYNASSETGEIIKQVRHLPQM